jgi:hypothetical protein
MWKQILQKRRLSLLIGLLVGGFLALAFLYLQNDIHRNYLDPKIPFQIYHPPAAPDYTKGDGWYLNPAHYYADPRKVDVFFVHGTSYNGGDQWLGSTTSNAIKAEVQRVQLPNYAAPFAIMGNVYAPKYRQGSLFTQLNLKEDSREARQFAYRDVSAAFTEFLKVRRGGRGFVIVGLEQGGVLASRLVRDVVANDPELKSQLVAAYFLETLVPESQFGVTAPTPACLSRRQVGCIVSYVSINSGRPDVALQVLQKAVYWQGETLQPMGSRKGVCVNPLNGTATDDEVDARHSQGATNATGLEWGTEPALSVRKISAHCLGGLLFVDKPKSPSFKDDGTWEDQRKVNSYNLFYGDLQADIQTRWQLFEATPPPV